MINKLAEKYNISAMTIMEIGSWTGLSAREFAMRFNKVICVDPMKPTVEVTLRYNMDEVKKLFLQRTKMFNNIELIEKRFQDVEVFDRDEIIIKDEKKHILFKKYNIDVIYIDGEHTYQACKHDIEKAKRMGIKIICGHDYVKRFPGVMKAVNETLGKPDYWFHDWSWIKILK